MSEILDALKRSEAARLRDDAVATPMPAPVWHASKPRPIWPWLAVLAVVGVVLVGIWQNRSELWPERFPAPAEADAGPKPRKADPEQAPTAVAASPTKPAHLQHVDPAPAPVEPAPPPSTMPPTSTPDIQPDPSAPAYVAALAPIPAPTPVPPPAASPPDPATPAAAPPMPPTGEVPPTPPIGGVPPGQAPMAPAPVASADPNLSAQPPAANVDPNLPAVAIAESGADPNTTALVSPPADTASNTPIEATAPINPDDQLPRYEDLPYSLRRDLPPVKFSMHRYAADPNQRFVVYKERRISDNGVLGQDLWLKRVLPDGAVLEFRGTEFRVGRD